MLNSAVVTSTVVLMLAVDKGAGQFWSQGWDSDELRAGATWEHDSKEEKAGSAWGQAQQQRRRQHSFQERHRYSHNYYYDNYDEYYGKLNNFLSSYLYLEFSIASMHK